MRYDDVVEFLFIIGLLSAFFGGLMILFTTISNDCKCPHLIISSKINGKETIYGYCFHSINPNQNLNYSVIICEK